MEREELKTVLFPFTKMDGFGLRGPQEKSFSEQKKKNNDNTSALHPALVAPVSQTTPPPHSILSPQPFST